MTQAQAAVDADPPGQPAGPPRQTGYLHLLQLPGAARFSIAAAIGRIPMAMFGLGSVLLLRATTGQYGLAGTIAGAGSIGYAVCAPRIARLADHVGQRLVLRAPVWLLFITGMLAGSSMPSLGSMVRARWSYLLAGSPTLHSAFALESVAEEMIFVAAPAVVTPLATKVLPAAGVLVSMVVCLAGTLLFAAQRRTEPPPEPVGTRPRGAHRSLPGRGLLTLF